MHGETKKGSPETGFSSISKNAPASSVERPTRLAVVHHRFRGAGHHAEPRVEVLERRERRPDRGQVVAAAL